MLSLSGNLSLPVERCLASPDIDALGLTKMRVLYWNKVVFYEV